MSSARWMVVAVLFAASWGCGSGDGGSDSHAGKPDLGGVFIDVNYGGEDPGESGDPGQPGQDPGTPPEDPGQPGQDLGTPDPGQPGQDPGPIEDPGTVEDPGVPDPGQPDPGPPCDFKVSPNGLVDQCDGTLKDPKTGRFWQQDQYMTSDLKSARNYCQTLYLGGVLGWRLPSIDELRELVLGCPASARGGACGVTATCFKETCFDATNCGGCGIGSGPGTDGCYLDPFFKKPCLLQWSTTQVPAAYAGDLRAWYVTFFDAAIDRPPPGQPMNTASVRCVRP